MALSGSFSGSIYNDYYIARVEWSATQSIADNTSEITATLYLDVYAALSISANRTHYIYIDGEEFAIDAPSRIDDTGSYEIGTVSKTIKHNSDGTKAISMALYFDFKATINGTYYASIEASTSETLETIARASVPTLSASSVNFGSKVTITTNRASDSFTHKFWYSVDNKTWSDAISFTTATYAWTVPNSLMNSFPNATKATLYLCLRTMSGSTQIGSDQYFNLTANVPTSVVPSISKITCTDPKGYLSTYGGYVQSKSTLKVAVTAAGSYSSTIKSYKITANGQNYSSNNCTTGVLTISGTNTISVTVTDSRGRTATKTATINVLAYQSPTISTLTAYRCDSAGNADESGSYMKITMKASITSLNSKNANKYELWYRVAGGSWGSAYKTYTGYSLATSIIVSISTENSYEIYLSAHDSFYTGYDVKKTILVGTAFTLMDFRTTGKGIGIGKVSEKDALEIELDMYAKRISVGCEQSYDNSIACSNWFRSIGNTGWYSQTYGGGIRMTDANWVRILNDKGFYTGGSIKGGKILTNAGNDLDAIAELVANKLDASRLPFKVQGGYSGSISVAAGNYTDKVITFNEEFSAAPNVIVSLYSTSTSMDMAYIQVVAHSATKTGFTIRVFNAGGAARTPAVQWLAYI